MTDASPDDDNPHVARPPRETKRSTQRQPLACRACTKSKVRCDKKIPCARCLRRHIPCELEDVEVSAKRRRRPFSLSPLAHTTDRSVNEASRPGDIITRPTLSTRTPENTHIARPSAARKSPPTLTIQAPSAGQGHSSHTVQSSGDHEANRNQAEFGDVATSIEGLAWGRHQCHKYPHRNCLRIGAPTVSPGTDILLTTLIEKLPDVETARWLVDFHIRLLCWSHNVLHTPTFLDQCESFWESAVIPDPQWVALYCAVLSSAAWSIQNSPHYSHDASVCLAQSATDLFDMTIKSLHHGDFLSRHTIFSLQCVCISGMLGNVLGKSDMLITMVNACIRIAQCLGLHHIPTGEIGEPWEDTVDREVGRRVWWKLVEMDYHSIPYTGTCSINSRHFTTRFPANCNDHDLREQADACLTNSSYTIIQAKMALLIPQLLDRPCAPQDVASSYEHIIDIDRQMRQLVAKIPSAILRDQKVPNSPSPEWLSVARRTLAIAAADKVIMIHRSFLLKSFQSPAYLFTRKTSVSAAMTILREHEELSSAGPDCPPIWLHSAFCVTAIVVICLDLLHCHATMAPDQRDRHLKLIRDARERLSMSNNDTMARRGVLLIDSMLDEEVLAESGRYDAADDKTRSIFSGILHRFHEQDQGHAWEALSNIHWEGLDQGLNGQFEDFDIWFNDTFR